MRSLYPFQMREAQRLLGAMGRVDQESEIRGREQEKREREGGEREREKGVGEKGKR